MSEAAPAAVRPEPPPAYRWLVLLACSVAMFGNYYVFDALYQDFPLLEKAFGLTGQQEGALDSIYNVAALLTLIGGGVLIDRLGTPRSAVLFGAIGALGTACIAVLPAAFPANPWAGMMVGRFLLGIGAELFIVAATTVVGRWFKGKEISFALAIQLLIARLGSWCADQSPNIPTVLASWRRALRAAAEGNEGFLARAIRPIARLGSGVVDHLSYLESLFTSWQKPLLFAAAVGLAWLVFAVVYAVLEARAARAYGIGKAGATDKLVLADLVRFDLGYWWVVGLCVAFYATIFPFRTFANLYLIDAHGVTPDEAGSLKAVLPLLSMIGMPIFGFVADKIGKRALLMAIGSALLVPPFLLMAHTHLPLRLSMGMLGVAFALVPAVLWPAVTYLVPEQRLGSAYALMTFCQQLFWALMSWGIGRVKDFAHASAEHPAGWLPIMWMLGALASVAFVFSFLLWKSEQGAHAHGLERVSPGSEAA